jgi:hypothetical protein
MRPVCETEWCKQDCVTWCEVDRTAMRQEQYVETIPCVDYDTITVDEGHYKMVWVPNPVQKVIPKTVYKQQIRTRAVPYTYKQRVPQFSSRWIPQQKVRYVAQTHQYHFRQPFCEPVQPIATAVPPVTCAVPQQPIMPGCAVPAPMDPNCAVPSPGFGSYPSVSPIDCPDGNCHITPPRGMSPMTAPGGPAPGGPAPGPVPAPGPDPYSEGGITPGAWSTIPARASAEANPLASMFGFGNPGPNWGRAPAPRGFNTNAATSGFANNGIGGMPAYPSGQQAVQQAGYSY